MLDRIRARHTTVVSYLAVFIALGGTAYAGLNLPRNSVGSKQIRPNAVKASEVKNGSLRLRDFRADELSDGPQGAQGPPGAQGLLGATGPEGPVGTFDPVTVQFEQATVALADNSSASYDVHCPDGQQAVSGGARGDATDSEFTRVTSSRPKISQANSGAPVDGGAFNGWRATVLNPTGGAPPGGDILPEVWVSCTNAPTTP
jgi:hypothetical protein